jgi:dynein heavy chain
LPFSQDKCAFPSPWKQSFFENKQKIERKLFITHPLMSSLIILWQDFLNLRFLNLQEIESNKDALRISGFKSMLLVQAEKCRSRLWTE